MIWLVVEPYPSGKRLHFAIEHGPFIVDLPTKDGDFPVRYVSSPEGNRRWSEKSYSCCRYTHTNIPNSYNMWCIFMFYIIFYHIILYYVILNIILN